MRAVVFAPMQKLFKTFFFTLSFNIKRAVPFVLGESYQTQTLSFLHRFKTKTDPLHMSVDSDFEKLSSHFIFRTQSAE